MDTDKYKPTLALDFDNVLHSYTSGWQGANIIQDPPVPGAVEFVTRAIEVFRVVIFSSRNFQVGGIDAMKRWLGEHQFPVDQLEFPTIKPSAFLVIDDRAIRFDGTFHDPRMLLELKTWQEK